MTAGSAEFDVALADGKLAVTGVLSFDTVPDVLTRTAAWIAASVQTVDLAGVRRADTAGLALMVEWLRRARLAGRSLKFIKIPEQVREIIRVNGLSRAFDIDPS